MPENRIHILDFEVANLIAAGEVVDRPASVIKELTENAIDSGATVITVEIKHGGITYMRVTDNGCGISFDDLPTAILRHATSKISTAADLDRIGTLGFRGEALAAIASVSKLRIISRPATAELGGLLCAVGGEIVEHTETGCSAGTNVIVEELFANVPARRKFLKKDSSEAAAIITVVERIALSRPDISFRLICNGEMKLRTEGNGDLLGAIYSVLGRDFHSRTIHVDYENSGLRVTGYIGMPDTARANRNGEIFFINGRYIRSKTAGAALEGAYNTYIPDDRFPACVLSLSLSPDTVDVNVHPSKLEVKFSNEKLVFETFYYAVRPALVEHMTRNTLKVTDGDDDDGGTPRSSADNYLRRASATAASFVPIRTGEPAPRTIKINTASDEGVIFGGVSERKTSDELNTSMSGSSSDPGSFTARLPEIPPAVRQRESELLAPERRTDAYVESAASSEENTPPEASALPMTEKNRVAFSSDNDRVTAPIPKYTILGEAWDCYVIVMVENKLVLIDKHAAHERILFEQMRRNMRLDPSVSSSQLLLVPIRVTLTQDEAASISEYADDIRSAGFDFTLDGTTSSVTAVPSGFTADMIPAMFETFGSELRTSAADARDEIFERALYTSACKAAIKGGRRYGTEHIRWICDELFRLPDIKYCPHGRPVALELTHSQLDRHFRRTE